MMRAIPLQRLSRFPGFPVSEQQVEEAVGRFARDGGMTSRAGASA
jgi:beta-glucosidase